MKNEIITKAIKRCVALDLLRGIAAFGIVGCHLSLAPRTVGGEWVTALCDFNVGVFAAIAGLLMGMKSGVAEPVRHGEHGSVWNYAWRRAKRLLPTYFFWSAVFIAATCAFDLLLDGGRVNPKYGTVVFWLRVVFIGDASTHLWFLPCLFYAQVVVKSLEWVAARAERGGCRGMGSVICLGLGLGLCIVSCWLGNWFGTYPLRLFAFLVTGYGLGRMGVNLPRVWSCGLTMVGLLAYVLFDGIVPTFVRGWFATVPLLVFFATMEGDGEISHKEHREHEEGGECRGWMGMAEVLGATSMGVYLVHPLFTRGLSVVWTRIFEAPFGAIAVFGEWLFAWVLALVAAVILLRLPVINRVVR